MAEKNLVRLSLFLVLIAFTFIYLIFADKNPDLWKRETSVLVSDKDGEQIINIPTDTITTDLDNPNYTEQDLLTKLKWIDNQGSSLVILSGTKLVYNELDALSKLGLKPKYILEGKDGIYFVNLGKWEIELSFRVNKFSWTIKTLTDLSEIKKNWFALTIMNYINLPTRKETKVIFSTKINTDNRLVEANKQAYYDNKVYISQTLNSAY